MNEDNEQQAEAIAKQVASLERTVQAKMSKEALERYGRVKMTHPQVAMEVLAILANLIRQNKTKHIDEATLKRLLHKVKL